MARDVQPTSLIMGVIFVIIIVSIWAYDKGTGKQFSL